MNAEYKAERSDTSTKGNGDKEKAVVLSLL
jgi:hypothetical protein